ncbi:hypothetical protein [Maricaulis sp.]|uniref:hypothetical protein n=1 Tax=Maricaulis sp. TaxID=1486257 RepID=UPI0026225AB5|nr:hypothetical protein [Maricaulis sp.]
MTSNAQNQAPLNPAPVPILQSVAAAYAFFVSHWRHAIMAAAPYTLSYAALLILLMQVGPEGTENSALSTLGFGLTLINLITSVALTSAMFRMAVRGDYSGWLHLKVGADEFRTFIVSVLMSVLTLVVFVLVFMFWLAFLSALVGGALSRAGIDPEASGFDLIEAMSYLTAMDAGVLIIAGLGCAAMMVWLTARLSLALPATIDKQKILVLSIWPLSKGQAWRIAAAILLASLPLLLVEVAIYEVLSLLTGERLLSGTVTVADTMPQPAGFERLGEYMRWFGLMAFINYPVMSGLYAYIYRHRVAAPAQD